MQPLKNSLWNNLNIYREKGLFRYLSLVFFKFFKHVGIGSNEDISRVNTRAMEMIESLGYKGFYNGKVTIENFIDSDYLLTQKEKLENALLKHAQEKSIGTYLKTKSL